MFHLMAGRSHQYSCDECSFQLERAAHEIIQLLSTSGLSIQLFTAASKNNELPYQDGAETCHLRVRSDASRSETISEKALQREMEMYRDLSRCYFGIVIDEKTGFVSSYR